MATGEIYARVSTDEIDNLQDSSRQLHDCRERLESAGDLQLDRASTLLPEVRQVDFSCTTGLEIYIGSLKFVGGYA